MDTILKAVQLFENKQSKEALNLLNQFLSEADDDEKYTIAEIYIQWGFLQEALDLLNELIDESPHDSELKLMASDIYIEMEDDETALQLLEQVTKDDPFYLQALLQSADLYQAQGLFEVAEQKLLEAKQLDPGEVIIDFGLGELYFSTGEYQKAILYYEKIDEGTREEFPVSIANRLGEAYAAAGEYEKSLEFFQLSEGSKDPDKLFKYGLTAFQAGRNDISIKAWERVIELDPYYHTVYGSLAKAYENEGMVQEGYKTAKKGLEVDSFNKELYFSAGVLAHQIGDRAESESLIRESITLDPDYKEAILFLIEIYKEREEHEKTIELISEVKNTGGSDPLYEWELARAYNEQELYKDALNAYKKAYNNLNQDSDFLKEYAYFLSEEGRIEEAVHMFKSYLVFEPDDFEIEEYVNRLDDTLDM